MAFARLLIYLELIKSRHASSLEAQSTRYWKSLLGDRVIRSFITDTVSYLLSLVVRSLPEKAGECSPPQMAWFLLTFSERKWSSEGRVKGIICLYLWGMEVRIFFDGEVWSQLHSINLPRGIYYGPGTVPNSERVRPYPRQEGPDAAAGHTVSRGQQRMGPIFSLRSLERVSLEKTALGLA